MIQVQQGGLCFTHGWYEDYSCPQHPNCTDPQSRFLRQGFDQNTVHDYELDNLENAVRRELLEDLITGLENAANNPDGFKDWNSWSDFRDDLIKDLQDLKGSLA